MGGQPNHPEIIAFGTSRLAAVTGTLLIDECIIRGSCKAHSYAATNLLCSVNIHQCFDYMFFVILRDLQSSGTWSNRKTEGALVHRAESVKNANLQISRVELMADQLTSS